MVRLAPDSPAIARKKLERVRNFGETHLSGIMRRSGESYAMHGIEVSAVVSELTADPSLQAVALLHDLLVHPDGERLLQEAPISSAERMLLQQMHMLRRLHIDTSTSDLDQVITTFIDNTSILPLRMAHRLNDVRHLDRFETALQKQIANETLHMYASIANRVGMHRWRYEMEDRCFPVVYVKISKELQRKAQEYANLDRTCIRHTTSFLRRKMKAAELSCSFSFRLKGLYSIYRKMVLKERRFEDLTDRLALRIILPTIEDCYRALGIVHGCMRPIPGKLKDYIGAPKENGYRSIHTVVYPLPGVSEQPIEIQLRTADMDRECEFGFASHGAYKEAMYALSSGGSRVSILNGLRTLRDEARSPQEFEAALRTYFRGDHLTIFDTKSCLYHLKKPATVLDFLCAVYGERSARTKLVHVNGREHPLHTPLHDGDTVGVQFGRDNRLTAEWLHYCNHKKAKELLRALQRQKK